MAVVPATALLAMSLSISGMLMLVVVEARRTEVIHSATSCLASGGKVTVKCKNDNQKISLKSVGYAYAKDCTRPAKENDCVQTSTHLSKVALARCDGKQSCEVVVLSIAGLSKIMAKKGPGQQSINSQMSGCAYNKRLQPSATMNVFQIKYACQDFQFCKQMKRSVDDLVIATEGWPMKAVTNPTCGCTFEAEDRELYIIHGIAQCNGSVTFVTEETTREGKVNKFEYVCKDKLGENIFSIGHRDPWKIKLTVDVEKSDKDSAYEFRFFNILPKLRQRRSKTVIKVDCEAGSLWPRYSGMLSDEGTRNLEVVQTASGCLAIGGKVLLRCIDNNQQIAIQSVKYLFTPDCSHPAEENDCVQLSVYLSKMTQAKCDGKQSCEVPVMSIYQLTRIMARRGPGQQHISAQMNLCAVDRRLWGMVYMNLFQVKYICQV